MNGDYIELADRHPKQTSSETLVELLQPRRHRTETSFPLLSLDEHNFLFVDVDPDRRGRRSSPSAMSTTTTRRGKPPPRTSSRAGVRHQHADALDSDISPEIITHTD